MQDETYVDATSLEPKGDFRTVLGRYMIEPTVDGGIMADRPPESDLEGFYYILATERDLRTISFSPTLTLPLFDAFYTYFALVPAVDKEVKRLSPCSGDTLVYHTEVKFNGWKRIADAVNCFFDSENAWTVEDYNVMEEVIQKVVGLQNELAVHPNTTSEPQSTVGSINAQMTTYVNNFTDKFMEEGIILLGYSK